MHSPSNVDVQSDRTFQWYCPFCDDPIDEEGPDSHASQHQDKGPTAAAVMVYFEKRPLCPACGDCMAVENWPGTDEYGYPGAWCGECDLYLDTYTLEELGVLDR